MKKQFLLPRKCRLIGLILFPLSWLNMIAIYRWDYKLPFLFKRYYWKGADGGTWNTILYDYSEQSAWVLVILSLSMIAFSRLKKEDEYVQSVRLSSILLSIYLYILFFIVIIIFSWDHALSFLLINIIPLLLLYISVFNYRMFILPRFTKSKTT